MAVKPLAALGLLCTLTLDLQAGALYASDLPTSSVPDEVRQVLTRLYPNATQTEWDYDKDEAYFEADFKLNGQDVELKISPKGHLLATKEDKSVAEIPKAVKDAVLAVYPGSKLLGANRLLKQDEEWWDVGLKLDNGHHKNVHCRPDGSDLR